MTAALIVTPAPAASPFKVKLHAVSYGAALVAERAYEAGEIVARFEDAPVVRQSQHTVQCGPGRHLKIDALANMNHSCRPNVAIDTEARTAVACRPIAAGEMLTYFYPSTEWHMEKPFVCQCGEAECLRVISGARYLSSDVLSRYYVNKHIVEAITATLTCGKISY